VVVVVVQIRFGVETLLDQKFVLLGSYLARGHVAVALFMYVLLNGAMVLASALLVAHYIPQAAGAGIAEVKGYLNGNRLPKAINVKTFFGKLFGTILNVAGSLPAGPEGPMIHIGAMVGGGVSQPRSKTMNCALPYTAKFCTDKDRRDFISVGTACGFAAAFRSVWVGPGRCALLQN
jgi:H+/Cl- antiporter ClcA